MFLLTGNSDWLVAEERPFPLNTEDKGASNTNGFGVGTLWPSLPRGGVMPRGAKFSFCISDSEKAAKNSGGWHSINQESEVKNGASDSARGCHSYTQT